MRALLVSLLLTCAIAVSAQRERFVRYNLTLERAEWLFIQGEHTAALAVYDSAFALVPFMGGDYFWAVKNALQAGRDDKANGLLVKAVENGLSPRQYYDSTVQAFLLSERAMPFLNTQELMEQRFRSRMDTVYIAALKRIGGGYRTVELPNGAIAEEKDTTAFEQLMRLVEERGFPTTRTVGDAVHLPQWLLLEQLTGYPDDPRWRRVLPYIQQAINTGGLPPDYLAVFQDLADHASGRPMTYGTLLQLFRQDDRILLASRAELDKARASVGLGPIDHALANAQVDLAKVVFSDGPGPSR